MQVSVNERIILLKNELKLTDIDFCNKSEISTGTLQRIKKGEPISSKIIFSISEGLNINREWILTGKGERDLPAKKNESANPWKDALIDEMKSEIEFLKQLLLNLSGKASANFNDAFDLASILKKNSVESVRVAA